MTAVDSASATIDVDLLIRVSGFLAYEADLLDAHKYEPWHALWAPACEYWVPSNGVDTDPNRHVSLIFDDEARLRDRVIRLREPSAYTQDPPSRICRVIGNVRVINAADDRVRVASRYLLETIRHGRHDIYTAMVEHELEATPDATSFVIHKKKVVLTANDEPLPNLLFLP